METLTEILEHEFFSAVQVKDPKFLQTCIALMTQNFLQKDAYQNSIDLFRQD